MPALTALVPLDGTELSETSFSLLPLLKTLGFDRVRLVSVWEGFWDVPAEYQERQEVGDAAERGRSFVTSYLAQRASTVRSGGFEVDQDVRLGRAADEILAASDGADLILIATHGRTGIARWWLGSVADQVVKEASCPVLVIGPNVSHELQPYALRRILVPLDGSAEAERALPLARWIASSSGAEVDLVRCMSLSTVAYDPGMAVYSGELLSSMEEAVRAYLDDARTKLPGINVRTDVLIGGPAQLLLDYLESRPAELVVMTSHGRRGIGRAALGSVTDRVLHGSSPVLVVRAGREQSLLSHAASAT